MPPRPPGPNPARPQPGGRARGRPPQGPKTGSWPPGSLVEEGQAVERLPVQRHHVQVLAGIGADLCRLAADRDLLAQLRNRQLDLYRTGWAGADREAKCGRLETLVLGLNFVLARRYGFKAECAPGVGRCGLLLACPGYSENDLGPRNAGMGRIEYDAGYRKGRRRRLRKRLLSGTEQQHYGKQNTQILDKPRARYTVDLDLPARNPPHPVLLPN